MQDKNKHHSPRVCSGPCYQSSTGSVITCIMSALCNTQGNSIHSWFTHAKKLQIQILKIPLFGFILNTSVEQITSFHTSSPFFPPFFFRFLLPCSNHSSVSSFSGYQVPVWFKKFAVTFLKNQFLSFKKISDEPKPMPTKNLKGFCSGE